MPSLVATPSIGGFFSNGVWTFGVTGTVSVGLIGGGTEIGIALDFRKGFQLGGYATLEHAVGAELSGGLILNYHKPISNTSNFGISNLNEWGESYNVGIPLWGVIGIDGTYGGNAIIPRFY
jgi:hypothetical protein